MKVWCVFEHWEYEGSHLVDIFSSKELAEKCVQVLKENKDEFDWSTNYIREWTINDTI